VCVYIYIYIYIRMFGFDNEFLWNSVCMCTCVRDCALFMGACALVWVTVHLYEWLCNRMSACALVSVTIHSYEWLCTCVSDYALVWVTMQSYECLCTCMRDRARVWATVFSHERSCTCTRAFARIHRRLSHKLTASGDMTNKHARNVYTCQVQLRPSSIPYRPWTSV
jgi:hypothetical protein